MKQTLLLTCILASFWGNAAPVYKQKNNTPMADGQAIQTYILQQQLSRQAYKTTGVQRRLIASSYTTNAMQTDSNHYYYSNGRGSTHAGPETYGNFYYLTAPLLTQNILSDSTVRWYNTGSGLEWISRMTYSYNKQNEATVADYLTSSFNIIENGLRNRTGKLFQVTSSDTFGGGVLLPKSTMYIRYNSQGYKTEDSTYNLITQQPTTKRTFSYDANNNLAEYATYSYKNGQWQIYFRNINTYDGSNRLVTSTSESDNGGVLVYSAKDSFAYTGSAVFYSYYLKSDWDMNNNTWQGVEILNYQLNSQGQPASYILQDYSTQWDTIERDVYTYDSYGLLEKINGYNYTGNGQFSPTPYDQSSYYFEDYYPTEVAALQDNQSSLIIYPNPATSTIQTGAITGASTLHIVNMNGQEVYRQSINGGGIISAKTGNLASGRYVLILSNKQGNTVANGSFVQQ